MIINFIKMHHLGNDFILIDFREIKKKSTFKLNEEKTKFTFESFFTAEKIKYLCDRHYGIGADGIIAVCNPPSAEYDLKMRILNSDGSEAEMCGNGLACFALYAAAKIAKFRTSIQINAGKTLKLNIETNAGPRAAFINFLQNGLYGTESFYKITLDMGSPEHLFTKKIKTCGRNYTINAISMGNPHCVIFPGRLPDSVEFTEAGASIERHKLFPDKTNVEFVQVNDYNEIKIMVWERGAGATLACGTGASAAAYMANKNGLCGKNIKIKLPGGECVAQIKPDGHVHLECVPYIVFKGWINSLF